MTFWSSDTLIQKLPQLISPFDKTLVESASYTLAIGNEIFVTADSKVTNSQHTKQTLQPHQGFVIPPGQFAFLLTEEIIRVPKDAIAFISIKATFKYKGLVNISGFHVDPGFYGRLLFSVYNAGPSPINLNRNLPFFLIWFASLDQVDSKPRTRAGFQDIPSSVLNQVTTDTIYSLQSLSSEFRDLRTIEFRDLEAKISDKIAEIDKTNREAKGYFDTLKWAGRAIYLVITAILAFISWGIYEIGSLAYNHWSKVHHIIESKHTITEYQEVLDNLIDEQKIKKTKSNRTKKTQKNQLLPNNNINDSHQGKL